MMLQSYLTFSGALKPTQPHVPHLDTGLPWHNILWAWLFHVCHPVLFTYFFLAFMKNPWQEEWKRWKQSKTLMYVHAYTYLQSRHICTFYIYVYYIHIFLLKYLDVSISQDSSQRPMIILWNRSRVLFNSYLFIKGAVNFSVLPYFSPAFMYFVLCDYKLMNCYLKACPFFTPSDV